MTKKKPNPVNTVDAKKASSANPAQAPADSASKQTAQTYKVNIHHRNGNNSKSQWTIPESAEIDCFSVAGKEGWLVKDVGWGLHKISGKPDWLGVAEDKATALFIAKFVGNQISTTGIEWHGYPANYRANSHDIPEQEVLRKWLTGSGLSAAKVRKIGKGQPCNL